jgi:S1-C subfamily serine protease
MSRFDDPYSPRRPAGRSSPWSFLGPLLVLLCLVLGLSWLVGGFGRRGDSDTDPNAAPRVVQARGDLAADEKSTIELFRTASPSVVYITSLAVQRDIFSLNAQEIPKGTGSGFVWDTDGHIVTNFHVIQDAQAAKVTLSDQSTWDARMVGADPHDDLAVLKIDAPSDKMPPLPIGSSNDLQVGQKVFAIGNPFGLDHTLTTGVVSAVGREIKSVTERPISGVIQTDAAINPGNSGGPLLDSAGRLIGVNTAIYSPSGAYAGIGFAIPVDLVNQVVPQLIKNRRIEKPTLPVKVADDRIARQLGIRNGVLILDVTTREAARVLQPTRRDRAGRIVLGDVIVAYDGKPVRRRDDLERLVSQSKIGDTVVLKVRHGQEQIEVEVTLQGG